MERKEVEQKIAQLQLFEQNLQNCIIQKQTFQTQLLEIDNALAELEQAKGETYKIIGPIMIAAKKESLKKDLAAKKEVADLRLKSLKKQEETIRERAQKLQTEILKELKETPEKNEPK